jgi:hypothetical protein
MRWIHLTITLLLTWKYPKQSASLPTGLCLHGACMKTLFSIPPRLTNSANSQHIYTLDILKHSKGNITVLLAWEPSALFWVTLHFLAFEHVNLTVHFPKVSYFPHFRSWCSQKSAVPPDSLRQIIGNNHISNPHQWYVVGNYLKLYAL